MVLLRRADLPMMALIAHWWHVLFHRDDTVIATAPGEIYLRCLKCGLAQDVGLKIGPLKVVKKFDGDPERFRLVRPLVVDFEVEIARLEIGYHEELAETRHTRPLSKHVH